MVVFCFLFSLNSFLSEQVQPLLASCLLNSHPPLKEAFPLHFHLTLSLKEVLSHPVENLVIDLTFHLCISLDVIIL